MRNVADVQQSVYAAEVDECAIRHEAANGAADGVAFLQGVVAGLENTAGLLFKHDAAIHDHIFIGDVEFGDAAVDLSPDQLFQLRCVFSAAAACGHKCADADIHREAALDDFGDGAHHGQLFVKGSLESRPVANLRDLEAGEFVVMLLVAACNGDRKAVAGLYRIGVVVKGGTGQNALGLVSDVEENLVCGKRDDGALQLPCAGLGLVRVGLLESGEQVGKGLCRFLVLGGGGGGFLEAIVCHGCLPYHSPMIQRSGVRRLIIPIPKRCL